VIKAIEALQKYQKELKDKNGAKKLL